MNEAKRNKASKNHTHNGLRNYFTGTFNASEYRKWRQSSLPPNSGDDFAKNFLENKLKNQNETLQINPQDENACVTKGDTLSALNKSDEAVSAYDKTIEIKLYDSKA